MAGNIDVIITRPDLTEDQILEAIGDVTQDVVVGTGNPDTIAICGERQQVESAVRALQKIARR